MSARQQGQSFQKDDLMYGYDRKRDDIDDDLGVLGSLSTHVAHEFTDWQPDQSNEKPSDIHENKQELNDAEKRYLRAVIDKPGEMSSAYSKAARISARKALEIRKRLVGLKYIREHKVSTAGKGRPSIILEPTDEGIQKIEEGA